MKAILFLAFDFLLGYSAMCMIFTWMDAKRFERESREQKERKPDNWRFNS